MCLGCSVAKFMCVGDLHLADRPPSACEDSYLEDMFDLILEANSLAVELGCSAIVQLGDLAHVKSPSRNSHQLVHRIIEVFGSSVVPWMGIVGNHDLTNDRHESLFTTQPLGVVIRSGAIRLLSGWADKPTWMGQPREEWSEVDNLPVYGVPWLQEWNYRENDRRVAHKAVERSLVDIRKRKHERVLVATHAPFYPPGTEPPWENYLVEDFAARLPANASVAYGHVHEPHGVYKVNGVNFCNFGALSRGSLHEYNLTREIAVALWDSETGEFEEIVLPHKPVSEVFKLQEAKEAKAATVELDEFLSSVGAATLETTSVESVLEHVRTLGLDATVVKVVEELLAEASSA
jgi:DNA repair exonuclease SbcCD nuclease subunit